MDNFSYKYTGLQFEEKITNVNFEWCQPKCHNYKRAGLQKEQKANYSWL